MDNRISITLASSAWRFTEPRQSPQQALQSTVHRASCVRAACRAGPLPIGVFRTKRGGEVPKILTREAKVRKNCSPYTKSLPLMIGYAFLLSRIAQQTSLRMPPLATPAENRPVTLVERQWGLLAVPR